MRSWAPIGACVVACLFGADARAKGSIVEIEATGTFDARTLDSSLGPSPPEPSGGSWIGGDGSLALTVFGSRVHDDDAAPPLQPFLQRTMRFRLEGGAGGASIAYPFYVDTMTNQYRSNLVSGHAAMSIDGFVGNWIYLGLAFGVDYETWQPRGAAPLTGFSPYMPSPQFIAATNSNELFLDGKARFGLRIRDILIAVGWHVVPVAIAGGPMQVSFWGGAFAEVKAVLRRFVELDARFEVLDTGFLLDGGATIWINGAVGLTLGAGGGRGNFPDAPQATFSRAGGRLGISWWPLGRFGMTLAYAPTWQRTTPVAGLGTAEEPFSFVQHFLTLSFTGRAR